MDDTEMLTFSLENTKAVDLLDLSTALTAFGQAFQDYAVAESGEPIGNFGLAVRELRTGSIIADLIPTPDQVSWLIDHKALLAGFVASLNDVAQFFLTGAMPGSGEPSRRVTEQLVKIVEPVAKDVGAQLNIAASDYAKIEVHQHITLNYRDTNALQNGARRLLSPGLPAEHFERDVLLVLEQVKNSATSTTGDRGIIEKISPRAVRLRFLTPESKRAILDLQGDNPLRCVFLVDVRIQSVGGQPKLYEISAVSDVIREPDAEH